MVYFSKKLTYLASVLALGALGTGCEVTITADFDGDGVDSEFDDCPGTASDEAVDAFGCSVVDDDGDGLRNQMDACPLMAATTANGCPDVITPTVGTLDGMWLINGVPASTATCAEAGLVTVRFNIDAVDGSDSSAYEFACGDQSFDSTDDPLGPRIEFNVMYTSFWEALDADGTVIAMTAPADLVLLNPPQHGTVFTPDFQIVVPNIMDIPLFWQDGPASLTYGTCAQAMLNGAGDTVTMMLYLAGEGAPFFSDVDGACRDTLTIDETIFPTLAAGSYELDVAATRMSDGLKWGVDACGIEYDGGVHITEGCEMDIVP